MKQIFGRLTVFSLTFFSVTALGAEGFHSISELHTRPEYRAFFAERPNCGSTRVHETRQIYLSALHCVIEGVDPSRSENFGDEMNWESLVYFDDLVGRTLPSGVKVLATGGCFTGFGIDVLNAETSANAHKAVDCAKGDWVIYETAAPLAADCAKVEQTPSSAGASILNLGSPKRRIERRTGMLELDGRVFSSGRVLALDQLVSHPSYSYGSLWSNLVLPFRSAGGEDALIVTDAEAIQGMSGGPILNSRFELAGVTTLAIVPNELWRYDVPTLDGGYHFGIHGGIRMREIFSQLENTQPGASSQYFRCP